MTLLIFLNTSNGVYISPTNVLRDKCNERLINYYVGPASS